MPNKLSYQDAQVLVEMLHNTMESLNIRGEVCLTSPEDGKYGAHLKVRYVILEFFVQPRDITELVNLAVKINDQLK